MVTMVPGENAQIVRNYTQPRTGSNLAPMTEKNLKTFIKIKNKTTACEQVPALETVTRLFIDLDFKGVDEDSADEMTGDFLDWVKHVLFPFVSIA